MGIACSTLGYSRPEDMLRDADTAMYKAKANGKACYEIFAPQMHTRAVEALTVENELRRALDNGEIKPYYQPIVSLDTGEVVGFEALARWIHADRGLISPADFIPLAEESGLIVPLGLSIMDQACRQAVQWQDEFDKPDLAISVNLSGKQFKVAGLIADIRDILSDTKLQPGALKVEITESMVINDTVAAIVMLKQLRRIGIQIAIDDFGTGYSSLSYLHRFPFDILKIDRSFISRMAKSRESRGIVKAIVMLAAELRKNVIAEGLEKTEEHRMLRAIGCQYGQGYLFSRPVDATSAGQLINVFRPTFDMNLTHTDQSVQLVG
jgi:EAL domain-containing protein (putative c-di-GMP-specific phosphodiesterase class I)